VLVDEQTPCLLDDDISYFLVLVVCLIKWNRASVITSVDDKTAGTPEQTEKINEQHRHVRTTNTSIWLEERRGSTLITFMIVQVYGLCLFLLSVKA